MNHTDPNTVLRFNQPLNLGSDLLMGITRPFMQTPLEPRAHDMLLLNVHPDLLSEAAPSAGDLTFFNFDRP